MKKSKLFENYNRLPREQRIQLKKYVCRLGTIFLLFLVLLNLLHSCRGSEDGHTEPEETPPVHVPVVEELRNVWIPEADEEQITVFCDGERLQFTIDADVKGDGGLPPVEQMREQLADVEITDDRVTAVTLKTDKITGKVLAADDGSVEIEGEGKIPFAADWKGYRLYRELTMCTTKDLTFGYADADFVIENNEICGILLVREETMENIRVLIKASDYADVLHQTVTLTADCDYRIQYSAGEAVKEERIPQGREITLDADSDYFAGGRMKVIPDLNTGKICLLSVHRNQGTPYYRGSMELLRTQEGIAVVNELPLEEYLYSVVPSEMPSSYPLEALKAQAICARTYAYGHMIRAGYPQYGAHVDDSTSYQVYNNITEADRTTTAVKETYGCMIYTENGLPANTYYYSTSCGVGTTADIWKTAEAGGLTYLVSSRLNPESILRQTGTTLPAGTDDLSREEVFHDFICSKQPEDYEAAEPWYRWTYTVEEADAEQMSEILEKRYQANEKLVLTLKDGDYISQNIKEFSKIKDISIVKRGAGGVADEMVILTDQGTYKVISEYNIRAVLCDGSSKVIRQDGSEVATPKLLPSAFFVIEPSHDKKNVVGYNIIGGGFGHGVGMSQNGAKNMALQGLDAEQILNFFYEGCKICSEN